MSTVKGRGARWSIKSAYGEPHPDIQGNVRRVDGPLGPRAGRSRTPPHPPPTRAARTRHNAAMS